MSWAKLDDRLHENPKVGAMSDKAFRLYILSITYTSSRRTRGKMNALEVNTVRRLAEATTAEVAELVKLRAWDEDGEGYQVHDYHIYNPDQEEISAKRSEAGKLGARSRWQNGKRKANAVANSRQTDGTGTPVPVSRIPLPVPVPDPVPTSTAIATAPRKKPRGNGSPPDSAVVWQAFQSAYVRRYGVEHPRSQTVNSQMVQFIGRIGLAEAPAVATFYVSHNKAYYVQQRHTVGAMLRDAEGLHTDWATGCKSSQREGREADRMQADDEMWERIDQRMEARRNTIEAIP